KSVASDAAWLATGAFAGAPDEAAADGDTEAATRARLANAATTVLRPAMDIIDSTLILKFLWSLPSDIINHHQRPDHRKVS
ncbi:hypothetical protein ACQ1Z2_14905, partial [Enterococcus faecalis]|uniref:hypothetical protein n=1 Tax=Enterococcus faecalis TaxID=1351 RepID=UPI003D6AB8AC